MNKEIVRAFIAVEPTDAIKENIARLDKKLPEPGIGLKPVSSDNMHLTLKFLGHTPAEKVREIKAVLGELTSGAKPFRLSFRGVGAFPSPERPLILWAGARDENSNLLSIQAELEERLEKTGFDREKRPYHPHATVARLEKNVKSGAKKAVGEWLEKNRDADFGEMEVRCLSLFRSELSARGAVHTPIAKFDFAESRP